MMIYIICVFLYILNIKNVAISKINNNNCYNYYDNAISNNINYK